MSDYQFTKDWFQWAPPVWQQLIPHMPERKTFLEIGSFEGRSTVWTVENMLEDGGDIICVDTWKGSEEHAPEDMDGVEARFDRNIALLKDRFPQRNIIKEKSTSVKALGLLAYEQHYKFDFIYIDGSHVAKDVMTDACMAWPLVKHGGFMVFDDYLWKPQGFATMQRPKIAVDTFVNLFEDELTLVMINYQLILKKL